ncbi:hypothetical protein H0H92_001847 [Tricholoma furcatifolium]|nr:hypothetical protein H0H92_001847 [Tricholoma furcatifolium]
MNEFEEAAKIDDQSVFSHIQLAVAQYKSGNLANSMATSRRTLQALPKRNEPQNYYGKLLLDQQRFSVTIEKFENAIELEKLKSAPNSAPLATAVQRPLVRSQTPCALHPSAGNANANLNMPPQVPEPLGDSSSYPLLSASYFDPTCTSHGVFLVWCVALILKERGETTMMNAHPVLALQRRLPCLTTFAV